MADAEGRLTDLEQRLEVVRDRIDRLQVQPEEKDKPWWRQTPSLPSLLALVVSLGTAVYSGWERKQQDVHAKQDELRRLVSSMVDLRMEFQTKLGSKEAAALPPNEREFFGGMFNRKRLIFLEDADNLVRQIPDHVSSSTYDFLSGEKISDGSVKAVSYLEKAIEVSQEPLTRLISMRNLGSLYAQRGPFFDMGKARKLFADAVNLIGENANDDATLYALGFTWEMWGSAEWGNGFADDGAKKMGKAREYYAKLSPWNPQRQAAFTFLENREQGFRAMSNGMGAINIPAPMPSPPPMLPLQSPVP